ncbi:hypothetical protein HK102_002422 [Quaeritorhiza haematococci]|nr:hypothetical protein HK102_002422 [Quaeritorhiza haematococci]
MASIDQKPPTTAGKRPYVSVDDSDLLHNQLETLNRMRSWRDGTALQSDPQAKDFCTDATLLRYLVARNFHFDHAFQMLQKTLEWRKTAVHENFTCERCDKVSSSHCFIPIGWDASGRVVVYGCPARATDTEVQPIVAHVVHCLEHCWKHPKSAGQWTWLVDFNGFGLSEAMQARLGISFATTFADHFPERLGRLILVNPPRVFSMLLSALKPFADHRTMEKIITVTGSAQAVREKLGEFEIGPEMAKWTETALGMRATANNIPPIPKEAVDLQIVTNAPWVVNGNHS